MSPKYLSSVALNEGNKIMLGRGYIFMLDYDIRIIKDRIQKLIDYFAPTSTEELEKLVHTYFGEFF